jgi:uncharacterized protein YdeI (BOF family)
MNPQSIVLTCALVLSMAVGAALAQNLPTSSPSQDPSMPNPPTTQDPTMQHPSTESPSENSPSSTSNSSTTSANSESERTFKGSLARTRSGGKYVLHSANGDYELVVNDTDQAQTLEGKDVIVTGTFDSRSNTIHVTSMEPSSAM